MRVWLMFLFVGMAWCAAVGQSCAGPSSLSGTVTDPTGAVVRGALVQVDGGSSGVVTDGNGVWRVGCLRAGSYALTVTADGFATATVAVVLRDGQVVVKVPVRLALATVEQAVAVDAGESGGRGTGATTLNERQLQGLADDPDDFARELQALASASGGAPGTARVTVDGFQNASRLPPKSAIARVVINPDMFSAEYEDPPYAGGQIEVFTKAGQDAFHGAVSGAFGPAGVNARDPLAVSSTPASKQRFGFELSGPLLRSKRADFSVDLEHRAVNETAVVDATTLAANGATQQDNETVAAPERLWLGNARVGRQIGGKDSLTASFAANVTDTDNKGVGGLVLPEAGYERGVQEYDLRVANTTFVSARVLQTARVGVSWKGAQEQPRSSAPQIVVAGAFVGGGSADGAAKTRERDLELDDDVLLQTKQHTVKVGVQLLGTWFNDVLPQQFNGVFTFGGGVAPLLTAQGAPAGGSAPIAGIEQYRRAVEKLPGGNATTYSVTRGSMRVPLQQWTTAVYVQEQWQIDSRFAVAAGLRWAAQTAPAIDGAPSPRLGVQTALGKNRDWVLHARAGLFNSLVTPASSLETVRLDGTRQTSLTVYSPAFADPLGAGSGPGIGEQRRFARGLGLSPSLQTQLGVEHGFFKTWSVQANYYYTAHWDVLRSRNVNAPLVTGEAGSVGAVGMPRPLGPNLNLFEYQSSGRLAGSLVFVGVNHFGQRFSLISGYLYNGLRSDADTADTFPQSSYEGRGDFARVTGLSPHRVFAVILYSLPLHIATSTNLSLGSGGAYDVTTGFDNNGDGVFNDRPAVVQAAGDGIYRTRFGLLDTGAVNGDLPRNVGTLPATVQLDVGLSREWTLGDKGAHGKRQETVRLEAKSANVLNHANFLSVDGVVGTPQFGMPLTADYGRRVEAGVRLSF